MKPLSLGRQELATVAGDGCIYVDKTCHVYELLHTGKAWFLSRPRRFDKSLLVNTMKEIFLGSRDLFIGTWIHDKIDWKPSPVIKLDFNLVPWRTQGLTAALLKTIHGIARANDVPLTSEGLDEALTELIVELSKKSGPIAIQVDGKLRQDVSPIEAMAQIREKG